MTDLIKPREDFISWEECWMRVAHTVAQRSKDPSTQVGAVIVNQDQVPISVGYNGAPRGIDSDQIPWERGGEFEDTKYAYVSHAEINAVVNSPVQTKYCTMYCTLFPCNVCAATIIQAGIKTLRYDQDTYHDKPFSKVARWMFHRAGIITYHYSFKGGE